MLNYNKKELIKFLYEKFDLLSDDILKDFQWNWNDSCYGDDPADLVEDRGYARAEEAPQEFAARELGAGYAIGASKVVFFFDEYPDIVIKVPLKGCAYINLDNLVSSCYDEYTQAKVNLGVEEDCWDDEWDYCSNESFYYNQSKIYGVDKLLTEVVYLTDIYDIPVYVAERVDSCNFTTKHKYSNKDLDSAENIKASYRSVDCYESVLAEIVADYGVNMCEQFLNFLRQTSIGDIHEANVGYDNDGKIKVLDYSGFNE